MQDKLFNRIKHSKYTASKSLEDLKTYLSSVTIKENKVNSCSKFVIMVIITSI